MRERHALAWPHDDGRGAAHLALEADGVPLARGRQRKDAGAAKAAQSHTHRESAHKQKKSHAVRRPRHAGRGAPAEARHAPSKLAELGQEGVDGAATCSASRLLGCSSLAAASGSHQLFDLLGGGEALLAALDGHLALAQLVHELAPAGGVAPSVGHFLFKVALPGLWW